jgi:hypothetical protein
VQRKHADGCTAAVPAQEGSRRRSLLGHAGVERRNRGEQGPGHRAVHQPERGTVEPSGPQRESIEGDLVEVGEETAADQLRRDAEDLSGRRRGRGHGRRGQVFEHWHRRGARAP